MHFMKTAVFGVILALTLAACGRESDDPAPSPTQLSPTPLPTLTWTPLPTTTVVPVESTQAQLPSATPLPTLEVLVGLAEGQEIDPPVNIDLPDGWQRFNLVQLYQDLFNDLRLVPATVYVGSIQRRVLAAHRIYRHAMGV